MGLSGINGHDPPPRVMWVSAGRGTVEARTGAGRAAVDTDWLVGDGSTGGPGRPGLCDSVRTGSPERSGERFEILPTRYQAVGQELTTLPTGRMWPGRLPHAQRGAAGTRGDVGGITKWRRGARA
ncbi:hypothetical protein GCM10022402_20940 [Salinactinospora qingdaonensis]|uniref:Uncharacterized protein n=1 Tax=Salinactinospora qingdaonensis TaxID=702744 RepID=A0ABP7FJ15_9ACTN